MPEINPTMLVMTFTLFVGVLALVGLYVVVKSVTSMSGSAFRATERERAQYMRTIERLLEKRDSPQPLRTSIQHANERMGEIRTEAEVEKTALNPDKQRLAEEFMNHPHESMHYASANDLDIHGGDGEL